MRRFASLLQSELVFAFVAVSSNNGASISLFLLLIAQSVARNVTPVLARMRVRVL
jgi:hypothetical protein